MGQHVFLAPVIHDPLRTLLRDVTMLYQNPQADFVDETKLELVFRANATAISRGHVAIQQAFTRPRYTLREAVECP